MNWPEPLTVKVLLAKLALPAGPTAPISRSAQPEGRGAETTVRVSVVLFVKLPEVPEMVTKAVPIVAALPAASVKVLVPVVLAGVKEGRTAAWQAHARQLTTAPESLLRGTLDMTA